MANLTPKPRPETQPQASDPPRPGPRGISSRADAPEVVDPVWLVKAMAFTLIAALVCGYLTVCLLFYQGQWQLVLHPSRTTPAPSSLAGAPFQTVRFGVDETATPQLTGWLIPADTTGRYAAYTVLYLPGGDGSLADAVPTLTSLRSIGINVFAFDYRGYGQSAPKKPNQKRMTEDAASAWQYLTVSRALPPSRILVFGSGLGCALAAQLAAAHPEIHAVVFQAPRPVVINTVLADPRTEWLPVRALFHERFDLIAPVSVLKTPKLFLLNSPEPGRPQSTFRELQQLTFAAESPKIIVTLRSDDFSSPIYREQLFKFLDEYLR